MSTRLYPVFGASAEKPLSLQRCEPTNCANGEILTAPGRAGGGVNLRSRTISLGVNHGQIHFRVGEEFPCARQRTQVISAEQKIAASRTDLDIGIEMIVMKISRWKPHAKG
jgi:hypothetical protein